ncbi:MAG: hypothetical protein LBO62_01425 [Endomicrobium sp.]|nr:hypothetical protein [Endomicrobium sp.]
MKNIKFGKTIIPFGVFPETHELETARFFNKLGKDIEFLRPIRSKGIRTPDIVMDGVLWEIKSPQGDSRRTIENNLRAALKGVTKNHNARSYRAFCDISASENLSVLALRTHCIFFFELPHNSRQLRALGLLETP